MTTVATYTDPPRIKHNEKLRDEFFKSRRSALFPKVTEQVESVVVNRRALPPFAYNGSIVRHDGRLLLAYRYHEGTLSTRLGIAELDEQFNVTACHVLQVPGKSVEDPRIWSYAGALRICYVESDWPSQPAKCVVKFGTVDLERWAITDVTQPNVGHNDWSGMEKNFVPWRHGFIYDTYPKHIVYDAGRSAHETPGARWRYGAIRGGCVVPFDGKLLRFFHSAVDAEPPPWFRRYFVSALLMEADPPFRVLRVASEPLVCGSEDDDLTPTERSACLQYKPKVVFPMGVIEHRDGWLLSCGINDSHIALLKITPEMIKI